MGAVEKRVTKEVTFRLSEREINEKAREAGGIRLAQAAISEEFKRVKSTFKGRIEEKENQLSSMLSAIHEGIEKRVVDCVERFDYAEAVVETLFGGDIVESRPMSNDERQMGLKFKKKGDDQAELPLPSEPSPSPVVGNPEPWLVELPAPDHVDQETFVPGEHDKPTKVRYAAEAWMQEPGEGATYRVISDDVFGTPTLLWRRLTKPGTEKPVEEPAAPAEEVQQ